MIVLNPIPQQNLRALLTRLPPRRNRSTRRFSAEIGEQAVRLVEDVALLLERHVAGVLVRVAVQPDLVAGVADQCAFLGKGLEGVARDEPGCFDVVLFEQL